MIELGQLLVGITEEFSCNYLPDEQERLLVLRDDRAKEPWPYEQLMANGFRRSGNDIYRPYCTACHACESMRLPIDTITLSSSMKRLLNKQRKANFHLTYQFNVPDNAYSLYSKYIEARHQDGSMYPPQFQHYSGIVNCDWMPSIFICLWDKDKLISVAVTDNMPSSLSAMYTFFDPDYSEFSLGTLAIIHQIQACWHFKKSWLYLGYQIDACTKMQYKQRFLPHERYHSGAWKRIESFRVC